jgi:hypothetical protein
MTQLASVPIPAIGVESTCPDIPTAEYRSRLEAATERLGAAGLDVLVVYADREHAANLSFLTGFDPRFEEALLLLDAHGRRLLLVGNECMGYLPDPALGLDVELFQELSLLGQQRDMSRPLRAICRDFGIARGYAVGCAGWKYFGGGLLDDPGHALEIPAYIVDLLRDLVGDPTRVRNAGTLFMDPADGLRSTNSVEQIARFEYASIRTSESVKSLVLGLEEGIAERDLEGCYRPGGLPLSCHPMIGFGDKARRGLSSPSANRARLGDAFTAAFGVEGALTCRAGAVAREARDLPADLREFYDRFARNYFACVAAWYEHVRVGAAARDVVARVEEQRDDRLLRLAVNPGHLIHLDEWVHSPFTAGSPVVLGSGMALQMDIIPVSQGPFCALNSEDGTVLADASLRLEVARRYPALWTRVQARRRFMRAELGIALHESVLPLSNIPGWLPPYGLAPERAMVHR